MTAGGGKVVQIEQKKFKQRLTESVFQGEENYIYLPGQ